ncbi:aminoacyl--tRNA ligase-related protein [Streptomyces sp. NPDC001137]|uniref:aminoacyl--tRNA ligase-related protein n=1 Tax=Streptomyces sp. NPDC001137 TaxID=3154378 RepID=UPI003319CB49
MAGLQSTLTSIDPAGSPGPSWQPPVVPQAVIERAEYAESFPHLLGTVHALEAETSEKDALDEGNRGPTDVVLAPAVCYGVYAHLADRHLAEARQFDVAGHCYRHEATSELGRFRSFRMREFVMVADDTALLEWRQKWMERCEELFARLGLKVSVQVASDPFFGPGSRFIRSSQVEQHLKYEFVAPLFDDDPGTAIASANNHKDHLGRRFGIDFLDQGPAHSSCTAFGLERIVLALIHAHGDDLADWPLPV